jgi:chemotaxis protein methyltransferase CheR
VQASTPELTVEEFLLLNELITGQLGVCFPEHKRELLASRLRPRLQALRLRRYFDYYLQLAGEFLLAGAPVRSQRDLDGECARLAELVTNHETYFFREMDQIGALFDLALAGLKAASATPGMLRVLCAGCASGEEAYTLALSARQRFAGMAGSTLTIDAFDVDAARVAMAQQAIYGPGAMRATPAELRERYFTPRGEERWELKTPYRTGVRFYWGNIVALDTFAPAVPYDAVFCRNVLIYFSEPALHLAAEHFAEVLRPGGLLLLGACESLIGLSSRFETIRLGPSIAYRKLGR